ncbi:hypothetical protein Tco_1291989, partial [Tanacetum coccineum]
MSDSDESGITHTECFSHLRIIQTSDHLEPMIRSYLSYLHASRDPYWRAASFGPPSPDYVAWLVRWPEGDAPPSPDYVPGVEHADDEIVAEDQPYAEDTSPIALLPDYVPESDPEADPEEDDDKDPTEDPIDYPADEGDDGELAYEQESIQTRQDLARSEAHCRALEARVIVLETDARRHEWQRQAADDLAVQYIMRTQA